MARKLFRSLKRIKKMRHELIVCGLVFYAILKTYPVLRSLLLLGLTIWLCVKILSIGRRFRRYITSKLSALYFTRLDLSLIDTLEPTQFEHYVAFLFERKGYSTLVTPRSGDYGADVIATNVRGKRTAIQAKLYKDDRSVGTKGVQEVYTSKAKYRCHHAIVVTNQAYTRQARELARCNGVELWDRHRLAEEIVLLNNTALIQGVFISAKRVVAIVLSRVPTPE